jgi:NADH-quinone oxidoreductase subunit G
MPKCTINGKEVEVKEGTSIIQAMADCGQKIAHYCWHPGLSVAGVCRVCTVEIEGNPRLQIACNTAVTEGMKVNNTSEKVREAVKWGLDFHLINHPLDCPVCDQAGECGLQDQYMEYGNYDSEMAEGKVKKHKVVDLGERVVLDSERCILCSRCVRFTDEVTGTKELGIFNRGDRSEIGTFEERPLNNKYSVNVVDLCPVGALTSKDFRFKQRVWYLKDGESICTGCSTGCNVKVYFNQEGVFRLKPRYNKDVNGYWMCDEGRDIYKYLNKEFRQLKGQKKSANGWEEQTAGATAKDAFKSLSGIIAKASLVVTGQPSTEELEILVSTFAKNFTSKQIYHWKNNEAKFGDFDGLLLRGDKNPNTKGVEEAFAKYQIQTKMEDLENALRKGSVETLVVAMPENTAVYSDLVQKIQLFGKVKNLVILTSMKLNPSDLHATQAWIIPTKTFVEKSGTYINYAGLMQKTKAITTIVSEALTLDQAMTLLTGGEISVGSYPKTVKVEQALIDLNQRPDQVLADGRKKNEFVFKRGNL